MIYLYKICFFLFRKRRKAYSIVERETAPLSLNRTLFEQKENLSLTGIVFLLNF